jgi:hypothetical protein
LSGGFTDRTRALSALFDGCGFDAPVSANIMQDVWDKWVQLAAGAGMNCMMPGSLGDILTALGGQEAISWPCTPKLAPWPPRQVFLDTGICRIHDKDIHHGRIAVEGVYVARHRTRRRH